MDVRLAGMQLNRLACSSPHFESQTFDALIHFSYEGSWLYYSTFGRQVNTSAGPLAQMCTLFTLFTFVILKSVHS